MATETEYARGRCPEHGQVEVSRALPAVKFPWAVNWVRRSIAARKTPFTCPRCGRTVDVR
jgi:predicted RNA-binding Zn-ribbon protein involved in translation (DUF1610 family)